MSEHIFDPPRDDSSSSEEALGDSGANLGEKAETSPIRLSEERKQALLAYWRDAFSGKIQPEVLRITP
jgi:hypothetical protein